MRMSEAVSSSARRARTGSAREASRRCMTASRSPKYSTLIRCAKRPSPASAGASSGNFLAQRASLRGGPTRGRAAETLNP